MNLVGGELYAGGSFERSCFKWCSCERTIDKMSLKAQKDEANKELREDVPSVDWARSFHLHYSSDPTRRRYQLQFIPPVDALAIGKEDMV